MAEVVVTFQDDGGDYANLATGNLTPEELQTEIDKFSTKHKDIVDLFEGKFFYFDEKLAVDGVPNPQFDEKPGFDNSIWILFSGSDNAPGNMGEGEVAEISTRDTYSAPDDKPYRDKAILRFFSNIKNETIENYGGDAPSSSFGFGENGFPDEFYQDLFKLTSKVFDDGELIWSIHSAVVVGYEGYYTAKLTLTENGIIQSTVYYEEEADGDIW